MKFSITSVLGAGRSPLQCERGWSAVARRAMPVVLAMAACAMAGPAAARAPAAPVTGKADAAPPKAAMCIGCHGIKG